MTAIAPPKTKSALNEALQYKFLELHSELDQLLEQLQQEIQTRRKDS